jgi:PAS domain S-box-containing protein
LPINDRSREEINELLHRVELQRKELEAQKRRLQKYHDRYVDLYDSAPAGYATFDADGYVQEINLTGARLLGTDRDLLTGFPLAEYVVKEDQEAFLDHVRQCVHGQREVTCELMLVARGGRSFTVQLQSIPAKSAEGEEDTHCRTAITDITERRQMEETVRQSEERLRLVLEAANIGWWQWDLTAGVLMADERCKVLLGLSPTAEPSHELLFQHVHPNDHLLVQRGLEEARARPGDYESEFRVIWPDGSVHWLLGKGRAIHDSAPRRVRLMGVAADITDRKRAEKEFQWVVESAPNAFVMADAEGRIVLVNAKTETLFGYPREELIGQPVEILMPEQFRAGHREDRRHFMANPEARPMGAGRDLSGRRKDGSKVAVEIGLSPIQTDKGTLVLASIVDISQRKRTEEALKAALVSAERAEAAAAHANRTKDHFLAVLSHELRTPLTPVVMGVSMLQDRPDLDPDMREMLATLRRNIEMEVRLIDDLLDVTRIARGKIELTRSPVELWTVIHRAVDVCKPDIEARGVHFGVDGASAVPYWVNADAPRLQQVFWNLLRNAVKFTPHDGCVGIRCRPNQTHVVIEVNDSGIGIEPEGLPRVFNAFEQVERSITRQFGGLGLGLAISKALVELHGGTISAHSEGRNRGAMFRVRLPLSAPVSQPSAPPPAASRQHVVRPLHILLVEDHGVTAKIMRMVLTADGHAVETAGDVATALEIADRHAYDLLISDLGLPDGSGHDLMRQLRSRGYKLPGIALSGYGQEEDIQRSYQAGFAAHLTKPTSREALVEAIASVTIGEIPTASVEPTTRSDARPGQGRDS